MPTAADILATKGGVVHCIEPAATVLQAVHKVNQHKLGALVVTDQGRLVGIFTQRQCRAAWSASGAERANLPRFSSW